MSDTEKIRNHLKLLVDINQKKLDYHLKLGNYDVVSFLQGKLESSKLILEDIELILKGETL